LTYNQQYSKNSGLYFAGEAYSVEGGWTEPALRLGLDAALHLIFNTGGVFMNGFNFKTDYSTYNTAWKPSSPWER
jgi:tryptophan 2-monooxygenase